MAKALSSSALVPKIYQGQQGLANSLIALELAHRMKISPLTVMQNMTPINGRPSWSSSFLIGTVNACGRFSPLRFIFDDEENPTSCYAEAKDLATGEILRGEKITIAMAKAEGWFGRSGSKWQTFPGQMLRYRAGAFWARVYCPEISLGIVTQEEAIDVEAVDVRVDEQLAPDLTVVEQVVGIALEALDTAAESDGDAIMVKSDALTAALAAIESAPAGASMDKFTTRAAELLKDGKINESEHATIAEAISARVPAADPADSPDPGVTPEPAAADPAPVALNLRSRQALLRTVNALAPEQKAALTAALVEQFGFSTETPISSQINLQSHADFINAYIKENTP